MLRSDLCNYSDAYNVPKGRITVRGTNGDNRRNKTESLGIMLHLGHAYQKKLKIFISLCQCIIC